MERERDSRGRFLPVKKERVKRRRFRRLLMVLLCRWFGHWERVLHLENSWEFPTAPAPGWVYTKFLRCNRCGWYFIECCFVTDGVTRTVKDVVAADHVQHMLDKARYGGPVDKEEPKYGVEMMRMYQRMRSGKW